MFKTVELSGEEFKADKLGGRNTIIVNFGNAELYASAYPDVVPDGDNVAAISPGGVMNLRDTYGTVYLLGTGKVQLMGTDYGSVNIGFPSGDSGGDTPGEETGGSVISEPFAVSGTLSETISGIAEYTEE